VDGRYRGLVPFKPGDEWKGNRNGRPRGSVSLTKIVREALAGDELAGKKTPDGRSVAEWLMDHAIRHAMNGNAAYFKEIMDRNDGKTPDVEQKADVSMEVIAEMEDADRRADDTTATQDPPDEVPQ
jgi:hypothetical protein